ncbi:BETA-like protein [Mya arenaria]|uniref:BETA-like protein n=1 Tax=Mya arenaria TaxID=6604 RepID=A0ABY7GCS9_MYAAR|nr:BETA-like protein [Mya arenaria]
MEHSSIMTLPVLFGNSHAERMGEMDDYVTFVEGGLRLFEATKSEIFNDMMDFLKAGETLVKAPIFYEPWRYIHLLNSTYDWAFLTVPQRNACLGMKGRRCFWPRGRVVGGSSSINVMQYTRGSPFDFDEWEANGCKGWGFKDVLPYFLKSEDMLMSEFKDSKYHNVGGPLAVSGGDVTPLAQVYRDAAKELGYAITDYNGESQEGFNKIQYNIRNGERSMPGTEMLMGLDRKNLHISVNSHVSKIDIHKNEAQGVWFIKDGRKMYVRANMEVILSAGTVGTPQLLMLSGIGPRRHLEEMNITVVADLPVGENLQDHEKVSVCVGIKQPLSITPSVLNSWKNWLRYKLFGTGPRSIAITDGSAYVHLNDSSKGKKYPDLQFVIYSTFIRKNIFNYNDDVAKEMIPESEEAHDVYWECIVRHTAVTQYHPTSTCKMGPDNDQTAVVDLRLRVRGVGRLRVVDASVFPAVTSGNVNAPTMMIAEKAADMIRGVNTSPPYVEKHYDQHLDHFNFISYGEKTFKQRYLMQDKWWTAGKGPIFFYTGNEGAITEFWDATGFMFDIAPQFGALVVFAEHLLNGHKIAKPGHSINLLCSPAEEPALSALRESRSDN